MISFLARFDPKTSDKRCLFKADYGMIQLLLRDENTNVNGLVFMIDMTGMQMKHQLFWGLEESKMQMHLVQVRSCNFEAYAW